MGTQETAQQGSSVTWEFLGSTASRAPLRSSRSRSSEVGPSTLFQQAPGCCWGTFQCWPHYLTLTALPGGEGTTISPISQMRKTKVREVTKLTMAAQLVRV